MTTTMGPPPPRTPATTTAPEPEPSTSTPKATVPMGPPPAPLNPNPPVPENPNSAGDATANTEAADQLQSTDSNSNDKQPKSQSQSPNAAVPYTIPPWSEAPCHKYSLEVLKEGAIVDQFDVHEKGAYMFGRVDLCDFVLEHPTISRFHAVLQFNKNGDAYIYDLSSTHGTFVNKNQVKKKVYMELHVGDVIRFGHSSRLYILQGPSDLMPPEKDLTTSRKAKVHEEMKDMEASLRRAKLEASLADGISWGMDEDAIEENEDDIDEITWQTYKGQLTEKQEKTRDKVLKRLEKVSNMKKEIDAIRVKDIAQGGLTQGQQTQIARNEQRILQIVEELENLEETLNESIRESLGARSGRKVHGKKKGATGGGEDDDDEYLSDDDEFYDRAKKKTPKGSENHSVETADSLLDKKEAIVKEMEDKNKLLVDEKGKSVQGNEAATQVEPEEGDALDAYMSGLSSQLVHDKSEQLEKELHVLQSELDRILYLLKIADPTGEAARKRGLQGQLSKPVLSNIPAPSMVKKVALQQDKQRGVEAKTNGSGQKQGVIASIVESSKKPENTEIVADAVESITTTYTAIKPQWLGAVEKTEVKLSQGEAPRSMVEGDKFVDYKDRQKVLGKPDTAQVGAETDLENAAPGLLIRKRKLVERSDVSEVEGSESISTSVGTEIKVEDAVALLLKHKKGYHAVEDETEAENAQPKQRNPLKKNDKKPKRILGPERPSYLDSEGNYDESWVPPEGQSGDGRTSLNDRFGY
ncbi:hypothetical protein DCAR_0208514 [Daucus carota subsp. sativus]|uniref:FHA domain-containing protein n=1 Tax=Daucus carota subsp. sativus TaxID=79200 RepID=A0AAF0WGS8_DAUCS|nr:PREDICTED: kanadaptin [Daucus carota subsp. sativus]WOG89277.1 hypothetical protein DCAR_0208514 [Daucus carota subsp. sativus]